MNVFDVGIIGGGVIGQGIAYELSKAGLKTAVFESGEIGGKATSAAAGMLGAHSENEKRDIFFELCLESRNLYPSLAKELLEQSGVDIELVQEGMYRLAFTEDEGRFLQSLADEDELEWHSRENVLANEPHVSEDIVGALWLKHDGQVKGSSVCQAYAKGARKYGASIFEQCPVFDVIKEGKAYKLVTSQGVFICGKVVVSSGVWSGFFFEKLGLRNPMKPVKGECLAIKPKKLVINKTVFYEHCYIVPKKDGTVIIGATSYENDWDTHPTVKGVSELMIKVQKIMPEIGSEPVVSAWSSLRPQTADGWPYFAEHPEHEGIFFATGHYRNGILLAPITSLIVKDMILKTNQYERYVHSFSLNRLLSDAKGR
ncbi:glycine oxidase ThiO [Aeribacillus sp. FSL K6-8210]|uniref:glycine oxidase ThiO n=1 Tax=Aeribacillus sp. FSL K6-8210 TaxID=2954683 RepID=UPI0030D2F2CA